MTKHARKFLSSASVFFLCELLSKYSHFYCQSVLDQDQTPYSLGSDLCPNSLQIILALHI